MPGWQNSDRRQRLPPDWPKIRQKRLELDKHQCQFVIDDLGTKCLKPATEVDHRKAKADDHRIEALQSLCEAHHAHKSGQEGGAASRAAYWKAISKSRKKFRRSESHPGSLI